MRKYVLAVISLFFSASSAFADGIGSWTYYPAYNGISKVDSVSNKCIYVLSSGNLYSVNKQEWSVSTYTRLTGLTDTDIINMKWNKQAKRLLLFYSNGNIDLLDLNDDVRNIPDIYMKQTTLDKSLYHIMMNGEYAYLSMGFGIAKINMQKAEISDTYILNEKIIQTAIDATSIYAKTSEGKVLTALLKDNLLDKASWRDYEGSTEILFREEEISEELIKSISSLYPSGPRYGLIGKINYNNGKLYLAENAGWGDDNADCPQIYDIENDSWTVLDDDTKAISKQTGIEYKNFNDVEVDPSNDNHLMISAQGGIYEFLAGNLVNFYTDTNSPMKSAVKGNSEYVLPSATKYSKDGKLWVALSQATDNVAMLSLSKDRNNWEQHFMNKWIYNNISFGHAQNMFIDSRGIVWWTNNHWWNPSLCGYDPSTDTPYCYNTFYNEDNTKVEVSSVKTVAEDKEGNLWIGTNVGPLMLEKDNVRSGNDVIWQQVKVPRNDGSNYADYLLAGLDITSIIVDGANRKWFATDGNGIYLIDSDNITQLNNFTSKNSMLPSDIVLALEINNSTGDVYIGTSKGLCSYRTNATQPVNEMDEESVYAYPNPVTPDYSGPITITGLSYDADVKITTASGQLVAKGRSNGGSFTWYGKDLSGKRVASGIYMVCVATAEGDKGVVTKIAVVN